MEYILGLAGHPQINGEIKSIVNNYFENVKIVDINVVDDSDLDSIKLKTHLIEKKCMGILFTDKDIYHLFYSRTKIKIQSTYLKDKKAEILKTLFKAYYRDETDLFNISIDSISYDEIKDMYNELGLLNGNKLQIQTIPFNLSGTELVERVTKGHITNNDSLGSTCITFFTETKNKLEKMKIPVLKVGINKDEVLRRVNELVSKSQVLIDANRDRVAILISLSDLKEHLILNNSEHNVVSEYNRISEAVYWFSEKVDGAYIPNDQRKYIIFCNRKNYEDSTEFSANIDVLNEISKKNYFTCNMGIGYGLSDREAIKNATIAQLKSTKEKKSSAYLFYNKDKIVGPLMPSITIKSKNSTIYDLKLKEIAEKSQIGINTIYKLYGIINKSGDSDYTSRDISDYLGITVRSTNRLFGKLIRGSFIKMVGEKSSGEKGRPIRVFRFLF